ncbi:MAG: 30S ribosomal protein S6e [Nanoarchaeota archaeon]
MNFKIVISDPKSKKAYQKEVDQNASTLLNKKIGHKFSGNVLGLTGYELEITGGSDKQGFPMRRDVDGTVRKKILISLPPGFHPEHKGQRKRKSICGNTVSSNIVQINAKITGQGQKSLAELMGAKKEEPKETPKEEKPAEKKEEPTKEEPKLEEAPAEEKSEPKEEQKSEEKSNEENK